MRRILLVIFSCIFLVMLGMTIRASLDNNVWSVPKAVVSDPWFQATLVDAYLGFITFYVWVVYRERTMFGRGFWLLAIMTLGNMAMSAYVLWKLYFLPNNAPLEALLLRKAKETPTQQTGGIS